MLEDTELAGIAELGLDELGTMEHAVHGMILCDHKGEVMVMGLVNDTTREMRVEDPRLDRMRRWYSKSPVADTDASAVRQRADISPPYCPEGAELELGVEYAESGYVDGSSAATADTAATPSISLPKSSTASPKCVMVGLPPNVRRSDLLAFLEPYQADILTVDIFAQLPNHVQPDTMRKGDGAGERATNDGDGVENEKGGATVTPCAAPLQLSSVAVMGMSTYAARSSLIGLYVTAIAWLSLPGQPTPLLLLRGASASVVTAPTAVAAYRCRCNEHTLGIAKSPMVFSPSISPLSTTSK
jgi:hypothetical protein